MSYIYPDRPDSIIEDGHKAPDRRKEDRSYIPIGLAIAVVLVLAVAAAVVT